MYSTEDTKDYRFKSLSVNQIKTVFTVPENWKECPSNKNVFFCFYKESNAAYSPNMNAVIFPFQHEIGEYIEKKVSKVITDYNGELVYKSSNPFFPEKRNELLMIRVRQESKEITFFSFVFKRGDYLVELNLSCESKEELFYEDLIKEMIVMTECENILL